MLTCKAGHVIAHDLALIGANSRSSSKQEATCTELAVQCDGDGKWVTVDGARPMPKCVKKELTGEDPVGFTITEEISYQSN